MKSRAFWLTTTLAISAGLILDACNSSTPNSGSLKSLEAGNNNAQVQSAALSPGLQGEYFPTLNLTGTAKSRTDAYINFFLDTQGPIAGIGAQQFSARWRGQLTAPDTGTYTIITTSDDGVRLSLSGKRIINDWASHGPTETRANVSLVAGQAVPLLLEYYQDLAQAVLKLEWIRSDGRREVIPPWALTTPATTTNPTNPTAPPVPVGNIWAANKLLAKTINVSAFEPTIESEWGQRRLEENDFARIKDAGFTAIRLPVKFSAHAADSAPYALEPTFMARIDWAIQNATSRGLAIIVDFHHYYPLSDFANAADQARFVGLWVQIAERYKSQPSSVIFELLNEPQRAIDPIWNQLAARALAEVRKTNPTRAVILGSVNYSEAGTLKDLSVPNDPNLIVTFHNYTPVPFTHQGEPYMNPPIPTGTAWPLMVLADPWLDNSWGTTVTPGTDGLNVTYLAGNNGLFFKRNAPIGGYSSLQLQTSRAMRLSISCFNQAAGGGVGGAKFFTIETVANTVSTVSLSSCGDGAAFKDLWIQNATASAQPTVTFKTVALTGAAGTQNLISDGETQVRNPIELAFQWGKANNRPMFMGEFGAFKGAEIGSRARWTRFVRTEAEKRGISWAYWEYHFTAGAFDPAANSWRPELLDALLK